MTLAGPQHPPECTRTPIRVENQNTSRWGRPQQLPPSMVDEERGPEKHSHAETVQRRDRNKWMTSNQPGEGLSLDRARTLAVMFSKKTQEVKTRAAESPDLPPGCLAIKPRVSYGNRTHRQATRSHLPPPSDVTWLQLEHDRPMRTPGQESHPLQTATEHFQPPKNSCP